jgi:heme A synthase
MNKQNTGNGIIVIAVLIAALVTIALMAADWGSARRSAILSVVFAALVTFFGILWLEARQHPTRAFTNSSVRAALAAATLVSYLVLVAVGTWFPGTDGGFSRLSDMLLSNFTYIAGIVIAFYFGSSAYVEAQGGAQRRSENETTLGD